MIVGGRIRAVWIEVRVLVSLQIDGRLCELIPYAKIHSQPGAHVPVVLRVESVIGIPLLNASPSRNEAKELPLVKDVAPGTLVPRKLNVFWPEIRSSPHPLAR